MKSVSKRRWVIPFAMLLLLGWGCGETDNEPTEEPNSAVDGKGDGTGGTAEGIMVEADAVGLGSGSIVDLIEVNGQWVAIDDDCSDGCIHAFEATAGTLSEPVTTGAEFELGPISSVALARHIENGLLVADDAQIAVIQLSADGAQLVSTTEFEGATALFGLASGAYFATDSGIHIANVRDGELVAVLEHTASPQSFTDIESGELRESTFAPVGLDSGGSFLWITMSDGTVWRTPLNISTGISDPIVMGVSEPIIDIGFALETVGITASDFLKLSPGASQSDLLFENPALVDVAPVNEANIFLLDSNRGPGLVQIATEVVGPGEIEWQYTWTLFAPFSDYEKGVAFSDDVVGLSSLIVREGVATLLVRP